MATHSGAVIFSVGLHSVLCVRKADSESWQFPHLESAEADEESAAAAVLKLTSLDVEGKFTTDHGEVSFCIHVPELQAAESTSALHVGIACRNLLFVPCGSVALLWHGCTDWPVFQLCPLLPCILQKAQTHAHRNACLVWDGSARCFARRIQNPNAC